MFCGPEAIILSLQKANYLSYNYFLAPPYGNAPGHVLGHALGHAHECVHGFSTWKVLSTPLDDKVRQYSYGSHLYGMLLANLDH